MELVTLAMAGTTFAALFPLVNPLNAVALFAVMTSDLTDSQRRREATKAGIYTGIILAVTAVAGAFILDFFGINLGMLQIAGGLIVGQSAWAMVTGNPAVSRTETNAWAREKHSPLRRVPRAVARSMETRNVTELREQLRRPRRDATAATAPHDPGSTEVARLAPTSGDAGGSAGTAGAPAPVASGQPAPEQPSAIVKDIAFSPVAMPMLAGPAAMGVVVGLTSQSASVAADFGIFIGIFAISVVAIYGLRASNAILHTLGASGILALQRVFGFILLAIAVALVAGGISALFGIPIYTD